MKRLFRLLIIPLSLVVMCGTIGVNPKRPTKVTKAKDINPSQLEKIFQYYDKQIEQFHTDIPVTIRTYIQSSPSASLTPLITAAITNKQSLIDTTTWDATRAWVLSQGFGTGSGDITEVQSGVGLLGGNSTGGVTLSADTSFLATNDKVNQRQSYLDTTLYDATKSWTAINFLRDTGAKYGKHYQSDSAAIESGGGYVIANPTKDDTIKAKSNYNAGGGTRFGAIMVPSNTSLFLPYSKKYLRLRQADTIVSGHHMLYAQYKSNVSIYGGRLDGNAQNYATNPGMTEWDAGIALTSPTDAIIQGYNIRNTAGDGIYAAPVIHYTAESLPAISATVPPTNVIFQNGIIRVPSYQLKSALGNTANQQIGRNGIAPTAAKRMIIQNQIIFGGNPAAIDLESSNYNVPTEEVIIDNCIIDGLSYGAGLIVSSTSNTIVVDRINVAQNALCDSTVIICSGYPNAQYGQRRTIVSNTATNSSGQTTIVVTPNWSTNPAHVSGASYDYSIGRSTGSGIMIHGGNSIKQITISNCIIKNVAGLGVRLQQGGANTTTQIRIVNTRIDSCWTSGIQVSAISNLQISGCEITNSGYHGVEIVNSNHVLINDNLIHHNQGWGVAIYASTQGSCNDITISDNSIYDNATSLGSVYDGIMAWKTDFLSIIGNRIYDTSGGTGYGIELDACREIRIGFNTIYGYAGGDVSANAACKFREGLQDWDDNYGIGIRSIPSATYSLVVRDSINQTNYTAIDGGVIYPNAVNAANKININGGTLQLIGDDISALAAHDTAGTETVIASASITSDGNTPLLSANGPVRLKSYTSSAMGALATPDAGWIAYNSTDNRLSVYTGSAWANLLLSADNKFLGVKPANYQASEGDLWVSATNDTLWHKYSSVGSSFWVRSGTSTAH